jgi:DNA-directed RNA polymerase
MDDENQMTFHTHLPIQLDATCNGFQHMALLSNEDTLFKELNLVSKEKEKDYNETIPSDFYTFLLHKVISTLNYKLENNIKDDEYDNYERLNKFMWDRSYIKKAVMTIPYNSSSRSMIKYVKEGLCIVENPKDESDTV